MDCLLFSQVSVNFDFESNDNSFQNSFSESLSIPLQSNVNYREISHRVIESQKLPLFIENELMQKLKNFIDDETDRLYDIKSDQSLQQFNELIDNNSCELINYKYNKIDTNEKTIDNCCDDEEFYIMYHELIHSGILTESLMKFENSYSMAVKDLISSRDQSYQELLSKQTKEMEDAIRSIGTTFSEENINALSMNHFEESEKLRDNWNNAIANLKHEQKLELHEWIRKVYEDYRNGNPDFITSNFRSLSINSNEKINMNYDEIDWTNTSSGSHNRMEESFTINLGAQLKTTHNLRLISMDILDLCRMTSRY
jgi:hypothetical protein